MPDPQTTNISLSVPARGSNVGTWDAPLNGDMTIIDACFGSVTSVALSNVSPVALTATQAQANVLRFTGTLTANVVVTIPAIVKGWTVENLCTVGIFGVFVQNASGGQQIGLPPGTSIDVYSDGTNMKYRNLGLIGSYVDIAAPSIPSWILSSTVPPYLNCDGSTFSAVTYPQLAAFLGTTTLPDARGRSRANLNGGTGRITTAGSGIDGDTRFSAGGAQTVSILQANLPSVNFGVTIPAGQGLHSHTLNIAPLIGGPGGFGFSNGSNAGQYNVAVSPETLPAMSGSAASGGSGAAVNKMGPTYIGGITLIRAA